MVNYEGVVGTPEAPTAVLGVAEGRAVYRTAWDVEVETRREAHRLARIAAVRREAAELEMREEVGRLPPSRRKRSNGASSVFALRLSHDERTTLEARADVLGLPPSVLARNFIRIGLTRTDVQTDEVLDRIDSQLIELRALLGR